MTLRGVAAIALIVVASACDDGATRRSDRDDTRRTRPANTAASTPTRDDDSSDTLERLLERAPVAENGTRYLQINLPNGQGFALSIAADAVDILGSMELSEKIYVHCPGTSCGDAEPTAYATENLPSARVIEELPGGDGDPALLVEHGGTKALRYVRPGWTLQVLLTYVPESAYARWAAGLAPVVDENGWLQVGTSGGLQIGSGGGLNPVVTFLNDAGSVRLITGTTCSPTNDMNPSGTERFPTKCDPTTGILISADGEPEVVGRLVSAISVVGR